MYMKEDTEGGISVDIYMDICICCCFIKNIIMAIK